MSDSEKKMQVKRMRVEDAARQMGVSAQYVRHGLRQGLFPFGEAVKMSTVWTYRIDPVKFEEFMNGTVQKQSLH